MAASKATALKTNITKTLHLWKPATWEDYLGYRDALPTERVRLYFHQGYLLIEMSSEGINRANSRYFSLELFRVH